MSLCCSAAAARHKTGRKEMLKKVFWFLVDYSTTLLPGILLVYAIANKKWDVAMGVMGGMVLTQCSFAIQDMLSRNPDQANSPQQPQDSASRQNPKEPVE